MILTVLVGKKNATVLMDSLKPNVGYGDRADFCRDLAALGALLPEIHNKKTPAPKSIRRHLHMCADPEI